MTNLGDGWSAVFLGCVGIFLPFDQELGVVIVIFILAVYGRVEGTARVICINVDVSYMWSACIRIKLQVYCQFLDRWLLACEDTTPSTV